MDIKLKLEESTWDEFWITIQRFILIAISRLQILVIPLFLLIIGLFTPYLSSKVRKKK